MSNDETEWLEEIEEVSDERNEWAWAAEELAVALRGLCEATGAESLEEGDAVWAAAFEALERFDRVCAAYGEES
jgi:hypothetical protein